MRVLIVNSLFLRLVLLLRFDPPLVEVLFLPRLVGLLLDVMSTVSITSGVIWLIVALPLFLVLVVASSKLTASLDVLFSVVRLRLVLGLSVMMLVLVLAMLVVSRRLVNWMLVLLRLLLILMLEVRCLLNVRNRHLVWILVANLVILTFPMFLIKFCSPAHADSHLDDMCQV